MASPRKPLPAKADRLELEAFAEKYETLALIYGDPVEVVFAIMATSTDVDRKLKAAEILISYRFPRIKAMEGLPPGGPTLNFNISMGEQPKVVDITPKAPELE